MLHFYRRLIEALKPELTPSSLLVILQDMNPENDVDLRMQALANLMAWIRIPTRRAGAEEGYTPNQSKTIRFKFLIQFLEHNPREQGFFIASLRELVGHGVAVRLYCMTGVSENSGFFSEFGDRLIQRFLPRIYSERDLAELFKAVFTEKADAHWFEDSYQTIIPAIRSIIDKNQISTTGLVSDLDDALIILGAQLSSLGVSKTIRKNLRSQKLAESHFVRLNKLINSSPRDVGLLTHEINECRLSLKRVRERAENTGVSVDLIYHLERANALLNRVELLMNLGRNQSDAEQARLVAEFMANLIRDEIRRQGVREFLNEHLSMLTKKIVERAGEKGDHYIAHTKEDKNKLFWAASGAGVLTAFTALIKTAIGFKHFPLLFEGLFIFVNYAVGFLLMQRWHLALSSKTPSFTASALSRKFEQFIESKRLTEITKEVRSLSYSQFIAATANLLWVVPMVMALDWGYFLAFDQHVLSADYAFEVIKKHSLLHSGTIIFSALTGVLLWLSSVVAGWIENWIVFRNIPLMLKENHFLKNFLGKEKASKFSEKFASTMGAAAGNLSIAFLLTFPSIFGKFVGLPLDIRHVTLATGTITLALQALPWDISILPLIFSMLISITAMGLLNFGVSFYCSIRMAALARGVPARYLRVVFKYAFYKGNPKGSQEII